MPSGFGNFIEMVIEGLHGLAQSVAGKWTATFFPIVMTIFLIVIVSNWIGLLPGVGTIGWLEHPHSTEIARLRRQRHHHDRRTGAAG